ncbi:MAG: hypothetical protein HY675_26280 [Chloroflexi bacterium]|nr:hypothetical protein [Chloroflexota bacterium]
MQRGSSRERFETVVKGGLPDCVPVAVGIDSQFATRYFGERLSKFYQDASVRTEILMAAQERFSPDITWQGNVSSQFVELFGGECDYRDDTYPISKGPVFETMVDLERARLASPNEIAAFRTSVETTRALAQRLGERIAIGAIVMGTFNVARALIGMERLMRGLLKERDFVLAVVSLACEAITRVAEDHIAAGAQFIHCPDATSSPAVLSPALYRDVALPYHRRFFEAVKKMGVPTIYHPCGGEYPILCPVLGMENVEVFHFSELVDPGVARQIAGPKVILQAGLNPQVLLHGTPDQVEAEVHRIIRTAGKDGRLIMGIGCAMPGNTPVANLDALIQGTRKHGSYPLQS